MMLVDNMMVPVLWLCRWGVASLADELAEPNQLCRLLLSSKVSTPQTVSSQAAE
jgi:hypothetical protein